MNVATGKIEDLILEIKQEIHVNAPLEVAFAALLEQLGPYAETAQGNAMPMKIEAWPGGRWYRDLGDNNGHFWGVVQAIKKPTLLEIAGPLMMSTPVNNNVQYRLSQVEGGTLIVFRHTALGLILDDHRAGVSHGWSYIHAAAKARAEASAPKTAGAGH